MCALCHNGKQRDGLHLLFECPTLQALRDKYHSLFGDHAGTICQFLWQNGTSAVAQFIRVCTDAQGDLDPQSKASDQP